MEDLKKQTGDDGGQCAGYSRRSVVGRRQQGAAASDLLEELERVVDPDSERCPPAADTRDHEAYIAGDDIQWNKWRRGDPCFDQEEYQNETQP